MKKIFSSLVLGLALSSPALAWKVTIISDSASFPGVVRLTVDVHTAVITTDMESSDPGSKGRFLSEVLSSNLKLCRQPRPRSLERSSHSLSSHDGIFV